MNAIITAEIALRTLALFSKMLAGLLAVRAVLVYLPKSGKTAAALDALTAPIVYPVCRFLEAARLSPALPIDVSAVAAMAVVLLFSRACELLAV